MEFKRIGHYKYELTENFKVDTELRPIRAYSVPDSKDRKSWYVCILSTGKLILRTNYAWDGASGPAMDTHSIMRGSLVHDGLYQLMRDGGLPLSYRKPADKLLRNMCREDGMFWLRSWWVYLAVRMFGKEAASGSK